MKPPPISRLSLHLEDRDISWDLERNRFMPGGQKLQPWTQADLQCQAWCDELRSLFKLALLSSFTVTRCLFVSSQRLRPDPKGNPSMASITRVNNLLKISLLFSLVTSVLCTISLQWLRVYQPRPHTPVEQAYALFKTRTTKLHRWNIRRGLTILPLLLQLAVVLFLGGLLDPLEIFGSPCTALVPILGMMVFTRYIWRLTKIENILET